MRKFLKLMGVVAGVALAPPPAQAETLAMPLAPASGRSLNTTEPEEGT